jgi:small acid-soluble spore protein H (minor)
VNVTWQGRSVWIDSVDAESGTARVHAENNPNEAMNVPVHELREQ